ncbi:hypothetical protein AALP_AAs65931U000100, partial [Arabis alpina]
MEGISISGDDSGA